MGDLALALKLTETASFKAFLSLFLIWSCKVAEDWNDMLMEFPDVEYGSLTLQTGLPTPKLTSGDSGLQRVQQNG